MTFLFGGTTKTLGCGAILEHCLVMRRITCQRQSGRG